MSALAVDYATTSTTAPDFDRMPERPHLVLVPAGALSNGSHLRPTRAARLLVTGAVALVLVVLASVATGAWGSVAPAPHSVTVQSGQTLSEIAAHELPTLPVSQAVVRIQQANAMSTSLVDAGEVLVIPAAD